MISPIICWENLFPEFVRKIVANGSNLVVHISNDNWFGRTSASRQHNLASVMRAVENRVPIVISSNTGPAQIIDVHGRVVAAAAEIFSQTLVVASVKPGVTLKTFYTRHGDLFACLCVLLVCMAGLINITLRLESLRLSRVKIIKRT